MTGAQILAAWADAVTRRDDTALAALFSRDVLFMATVPDPLIGRDAVLAYYRAVPAGLVATASLDAALPEGNGWRIVATIRFDVPEKGALTGRLTIVTRAVGAAQQIAFYHACLRR